MKKIGKMGTFLVVALLATSFVSCGTLGSLGVAAAGAAVSAFTSAKEKKAEQERLQAAEQQKEQERLQAAEREKQLRELEEHVEQARIAYDQERARQEQERIARQREERERQEKEKAEKKAKWLQSNDAKAYNALLNKAKDFENKGEYVYALGTYYDAWEAYTEYADDASNGFVKLSNIIKSGKPGTGTYNEFTIHDGWVALLQNAEKYWTEYCPFYLIFDIKKGDLDFATRTASYNVEINYARISKYEEIMNDTIITGLRKAWKEDWKDIPKNWPERSVYMNPQGKYLQNGAALFEIPSERSDSALRLNDIAWGGGRKGVYCAWNVYLDTRTNVWRDIEEYYRLYDMKLAICDLSGKELLKGERVLLGSGGSTYTFKGVSTAIMDLIDTGKTKIKVAELYLEYGKFNEADSTGGRAFIKNLPEVKIDVGKTRFRMSPNEP